MALNSSGPISLVGCCTGVSIRKELGLSGALGMTCTAVRGLAGVASGAITMPGNFYGKSASVPYMCITTVGATVYTCCSYFNCGNIKTAIWLGSGSFTVNALGTTSGYGNRVGTLFAGGGGGGSNFNAGGGGNIDGGIHPNSVSGIATCGQVVTQRTYSVTVGGGGSGGSSCTGGNGTNSFISCFTSSGSGGGGARNICSGRYGCSSSGCARYRSCSSKSGSYVAGAGGGGASGTGSGGNACGGGNGGTAGSPPGGYGNRVSAAASPGGGGGGGYCNYHWNSSNGLACGRQGANIGGTPGNAGVGGIAINGSVTRSPGSATPNGSGGGGGASGRSAGGSGASGFVVLKWRYK